MLIPIDINSIKNFISFVFSLDDLALILSTIFSFIVTLVTLKNNRIISLDNNQAQLRIKKLEITQKYKCEEKEKLIEAINKFIELSSMIINDKSKYNEVNPQLIKLTSIIKLYCYNAGSEVANFYGYLIDYIDGKDNFFSQNGLISLLYDCSEKLSKMVNEYYNLNKI